MRHEQAAGEGWGHLAARVQVLERRLRIRRRLEVALLLAAWPVSATLGRASTTKEVRAGRFVLADSAGRTRAELALEGSGVRLTLSDAAGVRRMSLAATDTGGMVAIHDALGAARATLDVDERQVPGFVLSDAQGRGRLRMQVKDTGPVVRLVDWDERLAVTLATDGAAPRLALSDSAGNDRLWLALRRDSPALQFLDQRGVARSGLTTFNDEAGVAVISGTDRASPGLVLYGKERTIVWSAP